ncbi:hypothetical protein HT031_004126 [Scenedesmus sp. PABB004]|nr:hypothetical protein HT031_004126 [Scenedesmus sp. PABB004]
MDPADASSLPSPAPVMELLNGFRKSKVLFTLVSLGVFDAVAAAPGRAGLTLPALARALSARRGGAEPSLDGLGRLCDAGVALGLLDGDRGAGYRPTPLAAAYLTSDAPCSLAGYVAHSDALLYRLWGELEAAVSSGRNCWAPAFGRDSADIFASVYAAEGDVLRFMRGMHGLSALSAAPVLTAFDLSPFTRLVDLGGATGALAGAAAALYPQLSAVVVDLPHVVDMARAHFGSSPAAAALGGRLSWVGGDFFEPGAAGALPVGDLYVLSRVLHDWEEARCLKLLRLVHDALPLGAPRAAAARPRGAARHPRARPPPDAPRTPAARRPGGALLVCEMLLDPGGLGPPEALLQSLNMLTQTHGRERSLAELTQLLSAAGFRRVQGRKTGSYLDAVIAYKTRHAPGSVEEAEAAEAAAEAEEAEAAAEAEAAGAVEGQEAGAPRGGSGAAGAADAADADGAAEAADAPGGGA